MIYPAGLDLLARILSLFVIGLLTWMVLQGLEYPSILLGIIIILAFVFAPRAYELTDSTLILHRWVGKKTIELAAIESARHIESEKLRFSIRTFAVGGLFGYYGLFYNKNFGKMTWFCTQRKNFIMLELKSDTKLVISPNELSLLNELKERLINSRPN